MSAVEAELRPRRTFFELSYFELAYLLANVAAVGSVARRVLPLPDADDATAEVKDYLEKGRVLLAARMSVLPDGETSYSSVLTVLVDGLSSAVASVVISLGTLEPTVVAAFIGYDRTIELVTLPGGQLLLGALEAVPFESTIVPSYLFEFGAESAQLMATRADDTRLWLTNSDGVVRGAKGDSFDLTAAGSTWLDAVESISSAVGAFLNDQA